MLSTRPQPFFDPDELAAVLKLLEDVVQFLFPGRRDAQGVQHFLFGKRFAALPEHPQHGNGFQGEDVAFFRRCSFAFPHGHSCISPSVAAQVRRPVAGGVAVW